MSTGCARGARPVGRFPGAVGRAGRLASTTRRRRSTTRCASRADASPGISCCARAAVRRTGTLRARSRAGRITDTLAGAASLTQAAARAEGLRYTTDREPGFAPAPRASASPICDAERARGERRRRRWRASAASRSLPLIRDVWICAHANGHLQATGRDARGRKQYRYHPRWRTHRDAHQVRPHARIRPCAAAHPPARVARSAPVRPAAREGARDDRAAARSARSSAWAMKSTRATTAHSG